MRCFAFRGGDQLVGPFRGQPELVGEILQDHTLVGAERPIDDCDFQECLDRAIGVVFQHRELVLEEVGILHRHFHHRVQRGASHAGTLRQDEEVVTHGGRVLGVTALGTDLPAALQRAYQAVDTIQFQGKTFRRDIGYRSGRSSPT